MSIDDVGGSGKAPDAKTPRPLDAVIVRGFLPELERCIHDIMPNMRGMVEHPDEWRAEGRFWAMTLGSHGGCMTMGRSGRDQIQVSERLSAISSARTLCIVPVNADMPDDPAMMAAHVVALIDEVARTPKRVNRSDQGSDQGDDLDLWFLAAAALAGSTESLVNSVDMATPWTPTRIGVEDSTAKTSPIGMPEDVQRRFDALVPMTVHVRPEIVRDEWRLTVSGTYRWRDPAETWSAAYDPIRTMRVMAEMTKFGVLIEGTET